MKIRASKIHEARRSHYSAEPSDKQSKRSSEVSFIDKRVEATTQAQLQAAADNGPQVAQLMAFQQAADKFTSQRGIVQSKENKTGLSDSLKFGIETLSGHSMDDVKVHFNSPKPTQLQAHAFAKGTEIHLGPGQEKHLPHEAWHVVQQKQHRVKPTMQLKGVNINDDSLLEREADKMGEKALKIGGLGRTTNESSSVPIANSESGHSSEIIQRVSYPCYIPGNNGPHHATAEPFNTIYDRDFTPGQKDSVYNDNDNGLTQQINLAAQVAAYTDDGGGADLVKTGSVKPHVSEIDHIVPKDLGGGNTMKNAQIIPGNRNASKGNTYPCPYTGRGGTRIYIHSNNYYLDNGTILGTNGGTQMVRIPNGTQMKHDMRFNAYEAQDMGFNPVVLNAGTNVPAGPFGQYNVTPQQAANQNMDYTFNAGFQLLADIAVTQQIYQSEGSPAAFFLNTLPAGHVLQHNLTVSPFDAANNGVVFYLDSGSALGNDMQLTFGQAHDLGYSWTINANLTANLDLPRTIASAKGVAPGKAIPD